MMELDIWYYLVLMYYDTIYNRIRYLVSQKSGITYAFFDLFDSLSLMLILMFISNVDAITLIKSVFNKNRTHQCYNILSEKCSHQLATD